ncbi:MAG TPA: 23S rRNA (uracil(1939)-C(5))-methyltransferase RlmD [Ferruginibacter sp.]|nr:23S rRNA (uracil(1939)-C(5))-methyltransferase RlmD [Ferruginibacter sp.]HMP19615.1 23S rRNA (uracil(1939)-C(5))-methyltransferase RlmD [Ferruginibacter sp.]
MKRKKFTLSNLPITGYAAEGRSVAKADGKVFFIEGAVPGDVVDAFISTNKKDWGQGRATRIIEYSKERAEPFCRHFGTCGGCKWQMLPYHKQLQYKQQETENNFKKIAKVPLPEILPIAGADATRQYRNKLEFTFSNKRYLSAEEIEKAGSITQENALGFHVPRIFDKVIDIQQCFLMDEVNNTIRNSIRAFAAQKNYSFYDIKQHTGWLRNIIIRYCSTGELMVNVCIGYKDDTATNELMEFIVQQVPGISSLYYTINPKWNDTIYDLTPVLYYGKGYVTEQLSKYRFKIGPKSFFQTNTRQAEKLYSIARDFAGLTGQEIVYDLYCGTGSIGIFVSDAAKKIIGVETVAEAIEDAKENAALNHISHALFFAGDVIDVCNDTFFETHGRPDVVITDPPRAGMHEKLVHKLLDIAAPKIVYVSCNTATQARDIALLAEKYEVVKLQPVDMFPHTHHIECVALLQLKNIAH